VRRRTVVATTTAVLAVAALLAPTAQAGGRKAPAPPPRPTALVTLGDSYISGEAGRWAGNSAVPLGSRAGTDRAWRSSGLGSYDATRVYGSTAGGCDRSDVAPALSNDVPVDARINLACSGAVTQNVFRASQGGTGQNGEQPQADQLAAVAATHDVETVVLSVGGNDLGFASIIQACVVAHATLSRCEPSQQALVDERMPAATAGVARAIDEVRTVLAAQGQPAGSYRLVLQTYPSPVPRGDENRYAEVAGGRLGVGGCPIGNADSDWARDSLVPQISDALAAVAADRGVDLLDLSDAFAGREVCARTATQSTGTPTAATAEWARFLDTDVQGYTQESLHPNAYGQQAMGRCYTLLSAVEGSARCLNTPGRGPDGMYLVPLGGGGA
jgi:lysophospholipase L1-like esterase